MAAKSEAPPTMRDNLALMLAFLFWYIGNTFYNQYNTMALKAVGGKHGGLTMTVSTMQLGVCSAYALLLWIIGYNPIKLFGMQAPDKMPLPKITKADLAKTLPVGCFSAAAHSAGVFCLGADPLFGQIVKAGEPVMSAAVSTFFYKGKESVAKLFCLVFIVGGVAFASLKKDEEGNYKLKFDQTALIAGMLGNTFAAFKGTETKKLMKAEGIKDRFGGVGNQFAVTEVLAFLVSLPVMIFTEGAKWGEFCQLIMTSKELQIGLLYSGMTFYLYNELATLTIKSVGPVASSVANTAKRVIVMVYMSMFVTFKPLTTEQQIGSAVAITFVMLYAVVDIMIAKITGPAKTEKKIN
eukprot:CAMPEP_0174721928 /NCGR_PEP_ID=MMETSP1094-20130205/37526_1 /TAXON_ID=156173 /ORGANISM="Chrysochromulina brevifilum, Strain UTEX LB 985" /LENGTH=351 /DNA_ID=CAMNT_0015922705 /DNA_START=30 /DNA_END=1085 /DNA_ORIENTATION=-